MMSIVLVLLSLAQSPVERARSLIAEGKSLEALQMLEEASRADPDDAEIFHALAAMYASAGQRNEALRAIERAVAIAPSEPTYAFAHGELLYQTGAYEAAATELKKASEIPEALMLLAAAYEKLGPPEKVFETMTRYLELRPEDNGARLLLGQQLETAKRYEDALSVYRGDLDDPVIAYHAAEVLARNRDGFNEAEALARASLAASPDMLEAGLLLARVLERQERHDEALAELETMKSLHPEAPQVYFNLTRAYQRAGRADEAKAAAERFRELDAKEQAESDRTARVAVTYKRAADLLQQGRMLEAEPIFQSVLEIDPNHAQTKSMLAKIAFSKGDVARARGLIVNAIADNENVAEFHYLRALFGLQLGESADIVPALQRALELEPGFADAWSMLGTLYLESGRAEDAVDCFLKASALEPSNDVIFLNLASAYAAMGNDTEEAAAMERYRELNRR